MKYCILKLSWYPLLTDLDSNEKHWGWGFIFYVRKRSWLIPLDLIYLYVNTNCNWSTRVVWTKNYLFLVVEIFIAIPAEFNSFNMDSMLPKTYSPSSLDRKWYSGWPKNNKAQKDTWSLLWTSSASNRHTHAHTHAHPCPLWCPSPPASLIYAFVYTHTHSNISYSFRSPFPNSPSTQRGSRKPHAHHILISFFLFFIIPLHMNF